MLIGDRCLLWIGLLLEYRKGCCFDKGCSFNSDASAIGKGLE